MALKVGVGEGKRTVYRYIFTYCGEYLLTTRHVRARFKVIPVTLVRRASTLYLRVFQGHHEMNNDVRWFKLGEDPQVQTDRATQNTSDFGPNMRRSQPPDAHHNADMRILGRHFCPVLIMTNLRFHPSGAILTLLHTTCTSWQYSNNSNTRGHGHPLVF